MRIQELEKWILDKGFVLNSRTRLYGEPVFKFAYQPTTGKLFLGYGRQTHKELVNIKSAKKLDRVVRGIYFRKQGIIYLRDHEKKAWLFETEIMLRANGLPPGHRVLWGWQAAKRLDDLLEGL